MADPVFLILLIIHVGAIVGWMGAALLFVSVVSPALPSMGNEGRADFIVSVLPRYMRYVLSTSVVAVIAGVVLFGYITEFAKSLAPSAAGLVYIEAGAVLGVIAFALVLAIILPSGGRLVNSLKETREKAPTSAAVGSTGQIARTQARLRGTASIVAILLVVALILMMIGGSV